MRTIEEIRADIDACYANLSHLVRVNEKWVADLPGINPVTRPVGYTNQKEGIRQQETAFASENSRLYILKAEEWLSSLEPLNYTELECLKDALKAASEVVKKEIKSEAEAIEKGGTSLFDK